MNNRITELGLYLENILETLNSNYRKINANFLGIETDNYSLDKIPTDSVVIEWITGDKIYQDTYSFRSRNAYSSDRLNNLNNIGFWEKFESIIENNNDKGILPNIKGIEKIECLNCGSVAVANTNTCAMDIQIRITYRDNDIDVISL